MRAGTRVRTGPDGALGNEVVIVKTLLWDDGTHFAYVPDGHNPQYWMLPPSTVLEPMAWEDVDPWNHAYAASLYLGSDARVEPLSGRCYDTARSITGDEWYCTRPDQHGGRHRSDGPDHVWAVWPDGHSFVR